MIRIGQRLQEEREKQRYSIEDIAKATKIRVQFLRAIEQGDYPSLPSVTYVQGFVKNYIDFLGLPRRPLLALFKREFNEKEYIGIMPENISARKEISLNRLRIRQAFILGFAALVGLLIYLFIQYHAAFFSPNLNVTSPKERTVIYSQTISIIGSTEPNSSVTVNNIPVFVDNSGSFKKEITVFSGSSIITIKSTNTFGKTSVVERHIMVKSSNF